MQPITPPDLVPLAPDRTQAVALNQDSVSRETWARLDQFITLLLRWQKTTNLVAASTIPHLWTRHVADSLQLIEIMPTARKWVDLGSGGGFPGLVLACALKNIAGAEIHLVESNRKKAAFLRECVHALALPALVHAVRIEDFVSNNDRAFDVVTARALAPLVDLLQYAFPLLKKGAVGLFPKGQDVDAELTAASKSWTIGAELITSKTAANARIVLVRDLVHL